jgi:transposase
MIQHRDDTQAAVVRLTPEDRWVLEARLRAPTSEQRDVVRARIVLLAAEGRSTRSIAASVGVMPLTVSTWRGRYAREGLAGLSDRPRPGPTPKYDAETGRRILAVLERPAPAGYARWTGGLIATELGDVHEQQVWRFLRRQRLDLDGRKSWCESDDPEFAAKAADVVGLYMAPPDKAMSSASTRSLPSKRWSVRRATSSCPTGARSAATVTTTSGTAPAHCLPHSIWRPAR